MLNAIQHHYQTSLSEGFRNPLDDLLIEMKSELQRQASERGIELPPYSTRSEEYSELQKAFILKDLKTIQRMLSARTFQGNPDTIPTEYLAYLLWAELPDFIKEKILQLPLSDADLRGELFAKSSAGVQQTVLGGALAKGKADLFTFFWAASSEEVKERGCKNGNPWLFEALAKEQRQISIFLLEQGAPVTILGANHTTALEAAIKGIESLGEDVVSEIASREDNFTQDMIKCRLLHLSFPSMSSALTGLGEEHIPKMVEQLIEILDLIKLEPECIFTDEVKEALQNGFGDPDSLAKAAMEKWSVLFCGWEGHSVSAVFLGNYCIKIDTGSGLEPGVQFYTMSNGSEETIKEVITQLKQNSDSHRVPGAQGKSYFHQGMDLVLGLEPLAFIPYKQTGGNCPLFAFQGALLTLITLKFLENARQELCEESILEAASFAKQTLSTFEDGYSFILIEEILPLIAKYPTLFDKEAVYNQLINLCIKENKRETLCMILHLEPQFRDLQDSVWGTSILQRVLTKAKCCLLDTLFIDLCDMGCSLTTQDKLGRTLFDDLQQKKPSLEEYESWLRVYESMPDRFNEVVCSLREHGLLPMLTEYESPDEGMSLGCIALREGKFRLFAFLCLLGYTSLSQDTIDLDSLSEADFKAILETAYAYGVPETDPRIMILLERYNAIADPSEE